MTTIERWDYFERRVGILLNAKGRRTAKAGNQKSRVNARKLIMRCWYHGDVPELSYENGRVTFHRVSEGKRWAIHSILVEAE